MHVRVRLFGQPDFIISVQSKLTKIEDFRGLIEAKCKVESKHQRLFYGGKLLENGYTFHDYNIKLNDVIQLLAFTESKEEKKEVKKSDLSDKEEKIVYEEAKSNLYAVGDLIDMIEEDLGAWFEGKIIGIVKDPNFIKPEDSNDDHTQESKSSITFKENQRDATETENSKSTTNLEKNKISPKNKKKGITDYFSKEPKNNSKITKSSEQKLENLKTDLGLLYKVHVDYYEKDVYCKLNEIRPRARNVINIEDLKEYQKVMINYNFSNISEKGYWYDFTVRDIQKLSTGYEIYGTVYVYTSDLIEQHHDTRVKVLDKIFAIEEVVPLCDRSDECKKRMITPTTPRSLPINCMKCRDDEDTPCDECGCFLCLGKEDPDKIILCDECDNGFHMSCLTPPLTALPEEDWYCPSCKRDPNEVVAPGAAKQAKKTTLSKTKRDWGRGMACVGKTKTCAMPPNHFGPIPGIEVGMTWRFRIQLSESGVHRPPVSGIHGRDVEGAYSIVLSGGYEDDMDEGFEFTYTGSGGRDLSGNRRTADQSADQTLTRENKALARNCAVKTISENGANAGDAWRDGKPVRVVRSYKMLKHFPQFAPKEGIRYDGIYKVVKYYPETGKSGFKVWKYLLRRDDSSPAPWEPGAKQFPVIYPDGYLEAEAEKRAQKEKGSAKKPKKSSKRHLNDFNNTSESVSDDSTKYKSPSPKKRKMRKSKIQTPNNRSVKNNKNNLKKKNSASPKKVMHSDAVLTKEEMKFVKADTLNSKLWEECLDICKEKGKQHFVEHMTQVFLCIICQEVVANPVTTKCQHNFCLTCLKLAFKSTGSFNCPYCRQKIPNDELPLNDNLKKALQTIMPGYDAGRK